MEALTEADKGRSRGLCDVLRFVWVCQLRHVWSTEDKRQRLMSLVAFRKTVAQLQQRFPFPVLLCLLICLENCANYDNYSHK